MRFTGRCRARGVNGASAARSGCAAAARGISTATMAATMSDRLDVTVTYDVPLRLRFGVAQPATGHAQVYGAFGADF